jgi:hypothetical protein
MCLVKMGVLPSKQTTIAIAAIYRIHRGECMREQSSGSGGPRVVVQRMFRGGAVARFC